MLRYVFHAFLLLALATSAQAEFDPSFEQGALRIDPRGRFMFDYLLDSSAPACEAGTQGPIRQALGHDRERQLPRR